MNENMKKERSIMKTLCIILCGSRKVWEKKPNAGATPAKDVYIGTFFRKCREYAEAFHPGSWCILSAKYGFLFPADIIPAPYDVSFNKKSSGPVTLEELEAQLREKGLHTYDAVVVLGGMNYTKIIEAIFTGKKIHNPLKCCGGIGYMMAKLNDAVKKGESL